MRDRCVDPWCPGCLGRAMLASAQRHNVEQAYLDGDDTYPLAGVESMEKQR